MPLSRSSRPPPGVRRQPPLAAVAHDMRAEHQVLHHIWGNPDCGLKTRMWEEVRPALENLVVAARRLREEVTANV